MLQFTFLNSIADIRAAAPEWDDLWQRSDCTSALARAEMVAHWLEHFAPHGRVRVAVVEESGRWLAALPLVERRVNGVLRGGALPCNEWPSGATLLWDADATTGEIGHVLTDGLAALPWQLIVLEAALPARESWQALHRALQAAHVPCDVRTRWHVGRQPIDHDAAPELLSRLSRKHRERLKRSLRKLARRGEVKFELHEHFHLQDVEPLLHRFLSVEDRGWKRRSGSSILRTSGAADFMLAQARFLAADDQLWLGFLRCDGRDAAACYQVFSKGVVHSFKIGYDEEFAGYSPGHLLHFHLLEAVHADRNVQAIDYIGAMTEYHESWRPETYPFARLAFSPQGKLLGRAAIAGYQWLKGPTEEMLPPVFDVQLPSANLETVG